LFIGKNPWQSHSFPRARPTLRQIARDPDRTMIVIDPRRSETAEMADIHLRVRPGTDAWCLAGMLGVLVQENLLDQAFVDRHTNGAHAVLAALADIPVPGFAAACGVPEALIRASAERIGTASAVTTYEDLGVQQAPNSTLVSYLNKLLWILTGNFGKPGTMYLHSAFAALAGAHAGGSGRGGRTRTTPVTGVVLLGRQRHLDSRLESSMAVRRVVPNIQSEAAQESREFYGLLGFEEVMNHGWIMTLASPSSPAAQISVMASDKTAPVAPDMSVEVDDVDAAYAVMQASGAEIIHPLQDEEWGVRRFFVRDPSGRVVNVLGHR
jgi:anaerobic selenocysteine-containing dehydrogenase